MLHEGAPLQGCLLQLNCGGCALANQEAAPRRPGNILCVVGHTVCVGWTAAGAWAMPMRTATKQRVRVLSNYC